MANPEPRLIPRWRITAFLVVGEALNYGDRSAFSAILAPLRTELVLSDVTLGLLGSLFLWSYALGSPFAGNFADRHSRTKVIVASLVLWSLFTGLTGLVSGLALLCICRVGLGLSECFYPPTAFALLADHHGASTRGRTMGILSIGSQAGVIAGGAGAGYLAQYYGWRVVFWVLGSGGLILALVAHSFLADVPKAARASTQTTFPTAVHYLIRTPSFHLLLAKQVLAESTTWTFFAWLPLYLLETFHLQLGAAGFEGMFMLQASLVFGIGIGGLISDAVARRGALRRMLMLGICYLIAAPFPLVFLYHPGFGTVASAVAACSLFRGLGSANDRPLVCDIVPVCFRSTAYGIMNTCATAAGAVGVFVAGLFKSKYGLETAFAASGALFLVTGALLVAGAYACMRRDVTRVERFEALALT